MRDNVLKRGCVNVIKPCDEHNTDYTSANSLAKHVRCKHSAILSCTFEEVHPRTEDCDDNSVSGESTIYENQFQCLRASLFIYRLLFNLIIYNHRQLIVFEIKCIVKLRHSSSFLHLHRIIYLVIIIN